MNTKLSHLTRFFPYESVHASNSFITIEDKDMSIYNAIVRLLDRYEANEYSNCHPGYFNLAIDNKITLEMNNSDGPIYLTYWDGLVQIGRAHV